MKFVTVNENEKGLLFKKGRFTALLGAGRYMTAGGRQIEIIPADGELASKRCRLETLLADEGVSASVTYVDVPDGSIAIHYRDGVCVGAITHGKHAFFSDVHKHEFVTADMTLPDVSDEIPRYVFESGYISHAFFVKVEVAEYERARLYFNKKLDRVLDPGTYYFWNSVVSVDYDIVDMRLCRLDVTGQEIMTQDKVSVRVNLVCSYRVTDCVGIMTDVDDFTSQLYTAAQLALREYIGKSRLDDIITDKDALSSRVLDRVRVKGREFCVEVTDADIKDIILPGEVRDIMNTVLVAEKKAQANVITRREEVASTRSLLNTAKLMEENKTLYRLKELEFIERICENVGSLTLSGSGDILSRLTSLIKAGGDEEK